MPVEDTGGAPTKPEKAAPAIVGEPKNKAPFTRKTTAPTKKKPAAKKPVAKPKPAPKPDPVVAYVGWWKWGIENRSRIAYSQGGERLVGEHEKPGTLPLETDCSGLTYTFADWSGLKLPYNGAGNTDSLLEQCETITIEQAEPGDLIEYGNGVRTEHVVTILARLSATDFECGSHGSATNPCHEVSHSAEAAYQASVGYPVVSFRRIPR